MKLIFIKPKNGILNNFLERQINEADLQGIEVTSKVLDGASIGYLANQNELSSYSYIFYINEKLVATYNRPLDYIDLETIVRVLRVIYE